MRSVLIFLVLILCVSCKNNTENSKSTSTEISKEIKENRKDVEHTESYQNKEWSYSLDYPANFRVLESELPGKSPVINLFPAKTNYNPPFAIHEKPDIAYMAVLPKGFGVDAPSGNSTDLVNWNGALPDVPNIDKDNSKIYLLENNSPWAYFIRFENAPSGWDNYGGIFVHFKINDFAAECFGKETGRQKKMEDCDPMGNDEVRYSGEIDEQTKAELISILESFKFKLNEKSDISELIQVEKPLPNKDVRSPLKVSGKAKGFWFFEANAPIEILDKDFKKIAESYIKAEGEWMTKDFVNFSGEIEFEGPDDERGYLVFKRANPSGKKENARQYRIPIIFPPK
ncbi:hypothetical protein G3I01_00635 [Gramella sp. MT6]|uniref:Gmad2 immunoglobulin-like domain-containing protein n=1 Tax=Gramella sp. MT6 TaxID=2705471 RepID=UPI001C5FE520|nr:Gmad2 immunoglobulin-like domain-containing protein [Gramella sp. MT6]QYA24074.1 hypothetical protein G3I01_00635 [Gramella sp. MT6]